MPRVLLVSEHVLLRQGLARILADEEPDATVGEAAGVGDALDRVGSFRPDIILLHIGYPVSAGMRALHLLQDTTPVVPIVLLLDVVDDEVVMIAIQSGVAGCLDRSVDAGRLVQAFRDAAEGEIALSECLARRLARVFAESRNGHRQQVPDALTARELQVLELVSRGLTNRDVAGTLFISESTVRAHLRTIVQKLGAQNRVHAVARALELGLVRAEG